VNGPSPEAIAWANGTARSEGVASQQIIATNFSTDLFSLPAGPLGFAIGAEYRKEKSDQIQDPLSATGALFYNAIGRTKGEYDITEGFTELVVPILKDKPFAYRLSLEAAERIGNYSTVGSISQWRLGAQWAPVQDLRFRGSKSTSVRAPNITDLFGPQARNFTTLGNDPCDSAQIAAVSGAKRSNRIANCAAAIPNYDPNTFVSNFGTGRQSLALLQGGNPDLDKESADTWSAGFVFTPRWVDGLNFSLDYWSIDIENAVSTIPINTLLGDLCYDAPAGSPFCNFITRDPTGTNGGGKPGGVSEVVLTNQNVQAIETSGIDVALSFQHAFERVGSFQFVAEATKLIKWNLQGTPGAPPTRFAGVLTGPFVATPRYKASGTVGWNLGKLGVQWQTRYTSPLALSEVDPPSSRDPFFTDNYFEHDVRGSYALSDRVKLRVGIVNVTNEHPPLVPEIGNASLLTTSIYDNRGRWYYVGGSYTFQ
jgi:outer membrane receptor protein involved in Fe transport